MSRSSKRRKRQKEKRRQAKKVSGLQSDILQEPENEESDLKLFEPKVRWRKFNDDAKGEVTDRLMELVRKKSTTVMSKDGEPVAVEGEADKNAISAAKILMTQESQSQKDEHFEKRQLTPRASGPQINVGVNVDNRTDDSGSRLDAIFKQLGVAGSIGVGTPEPPTGLTGPAESERIRIKASTKRKSKSDSESQRVAASRNLKRSADQEIGPLHDIANPQRRERACHENLLFAETYFGPTFYLGWAPYQRRMMDRFQEVATRGGKECHAVRRGGLKSTCARVSTLWAVVNGHRRFPVLVGATDGKSNEHRENFFDMLKASPLLLADYPELLPLILKKKQPKKSYRLDGRLLEVHAKDDKGRIVFADIYDAPSCQAHIAPYSVNATDVSGLAFVDRFGVTIRPDLLVFDDVQTPQSAKSPSITEQREDAIDKVFCGLEGRLQLSARASLARCIRMRSTCDRSLRIIRSVHRKRNAAIGIAFSAIASTIAKPTSVASFAATLVSLSI